MAGVVYTRGTPEGRQAVDRRRLLPDAPRKSFEASQLQDNYLEIARRAALGQKNVDIAADMSLAPETVSYIINSPIVRERIDALQLAADKSAVNVAQRIKNLAPDAMTVLEGIIKDGTLDEERIPAKIRADHAEKLLDRAGYAAPKEIRQHHMHGHYTKEDIEELKKRAVGRAQEANMIDVSPESLGTGD